MELKNKSIILFTSTVKDKVLATKKIASIRMNLFKSLRFSSSVNVNRDGFLTVLFEDRKDTCKGLNQNIVGNIPVTSEWWTPTIENTQKIVMYNVPIELLTKYLKNSLVNNKGEMLEVLEVPGMGKPDANGLLNNECPFYLASEYPV